MVDHIHFQYNGILLGILLWSIVAAREVRAAELLLSYRYTLTALILLPGQLTSLRLSVRRPPQLQAHLHLSRSSLLRLSAASALLHAERKCVIPWSLPACLQIADVLSNSPTEFSTDRLVELGVIVVAVFAISFGPFILTGGLPQVKQIFSRLFPFQRGLNHAYWAGNVWALVSLVDRILVKCRWRCYLEV